MEDIAIRVNNLTKAYKLYDSRADRVKEVFHPFRKKYHQTFNALDDVSFQVPKGETLGIVGRNGSGKSTLLQIICGILQATSGSVEVKGRVSALLELGTGFNPEFTGRQNVYINGSILGLTREAIKACFDDIIAFADIGDFINQPVKSYSSGMVVRLAFAVAISIDPDILIVDEALAVGDEAFQRKCYARIKKIQESGSTILFVSHGGGTIVELCNRALLLDQGELLICGLPKQVISHYHKLIFGPLDKIETIKNELRSDPNRFNLSAIDIGDNKEGENSKRPVNGNEKNADNDPGQKSFYVPDMVPKSTVYYEKRGAIIEHPHITTLDGTQVNMLVKGESYVYTYKVYFEQPAFKVGFGMMIKTTSGFELMGALSAPVGKGIEFIEAGTTVQLKYQFCCKLNPGVYFLNAGVAGVIDNQRLPLDRNLDIAMFRVQEEKNSTSPLIVDLIERVDVSVIKGN